MDGANTGKSALPTGFYGRFRLKLDVKGRLTLPSLYRRGLGAEDEGWLVLRPNPRGFVQVIPQPVWDSIVASRPSAAAPGSPEQQMKRRMEYSTLEVAQLDPKGRFTVPQPLVEVARITKDVLVLGVGRHMELWDPETWFALEKTHEGDGQDIDALLYS